MKYNKKVKSERNMKSNTSLKKRDKVRSKTRNNTSPVSPVFLNLKEDGLFHHISENLFQLEQNVEFFSFAIKEIEEITKQQ